MNGHFKDDDTQLELGEDDTTVALKKAWERTVRALGSRVSKSAYESFFRATRPLGLEDDTVVLGAPSGFAREWLEKRHGPILKSLMMTHLGRTTLQLRFVLASPERRPILGELPPFGPPPGQGDDAGEDTGSEPNKVAASPPKASSRRAPLPPELTLPLSDRYTFDTFVVGKSNRLAHAGAQAVGDAPGKIYNPLFLYGGPGLGKTHLMHAIGHAIRASHPDARVAYISGESFTNGYIAALRDRKSDDFRAAYRSVDIWLVDDIQTIAGKEHTKEEFFHTFNTLHQMDRQIVLSSDRSPRELRAMDERLITRFECGLFADITSPELETRMAILQKKATLENLDIPDDVLFYLANLIQSNIRSLEGALIKLMAYASLTKSPVTKQMASDVIGSYFVERRPVRPRAASRSGQSAPHDPEASPLQELPLPPIIASMYPPKNGLGPAPFAHIVQAVADHFGLDPCLLAGDGSIEHARRRPIATARQIAIYLTREKTSLAVNDLAHLFGGVSHSAISHAHRKMVEQLSREPKTLSLLQEISAKLDPSAY